MLTEGLGLAAAIFAVAAGLLGIYSARTTSERDDLQESTQAQDQTIQELNDEIASLEAERDDLQTEVSVLQDSSRTPNTSPPPQDEGGAVRREQTAVRLAEGNGLDLDSEEPDWGVDGASGEIDFTLGQYSSFAVSVGIMPEVPTYEACVANTSRVAEVNNSDIPAGTSMCVYTNRDRVAYVGVVDYSSEDDFMVVDVTVWETT